MNRPKADLIKKAIVKTPLESKNKIAEKSEVLLGVQLSKAAKQQFNVLAAEEGRLQKDLLAEALNDLFQKYGKARIA